MIFISPLRMPHFPDFSMLIHLHLQGTRNAQDASVFFLGIDVSFRTWKDRVGGRKPFFFVNPVVFQVQVPFNPSVEVMDG